MELVLAVVILIALLGLWVALPATKRASSHSSAHAPSASLQQKA
jgi:hypothetical protein